MQQMKKTLVILLIGFSLQVSAQDPQLFENTWYLQNLIINGDDNFPPSNSEVPFVTVSFDVPMFETYVCDVLNADINYNGGGEFELHNAGMTFADCDIQENTEFDILYLDDFYVANIFDPFTYTISNESNGSKTLTIISDNGDQAIYNSELLSLNDDSNSIISVYPIPTTDELSIEIGNELICIKINIVDVSGKLISAQNPDCLTEIRINVQKLTNGIYFIIMEVTNGRTLIKKFIKN